MRRKILNTVLVALVVGVLICGGSFIYDWAKPSSLFELKATLPPPQSAVEALALLTSEKHISDPYAYLTGSKEDVAGKYATYLQQVDAIQYLRAHKVTAGIPSLILYLDYGTSWKNMLWSQLNPGPDDNEMKEIYPASAALMEMPEAKDIVETYVLNQENPIAYRVACLEILGSIDRNAYNKEWIILKEQIKDPEVQAYLGYLKEGRAYFCGVPIFSKK